MISVKMTKNVGKLPKNDLKVINIKKFKPQISYSYSHANETH